MKATPEGCELRDELKETKAAVAALDTRLQRRRDAANGKAGNGEQGTGN